MSHDTRDASRPPVDWEAFARYLAGESTDEEVVVVRRWLDAHPGDADLLRALDGALDRLTTIAGTEIDVDDALRQVLARRDEPQVLPLRPRTVAAPTARPAYRWRGALRAAAVIVVAATGALAWWAARGASPSAAGATRTFATAVGRRDSVRLPDGSLVVLAPSSRLVIAATYGQGAREVDLTGEAYFDVKHDDAHTFTVRAAGTLIRDVGTTFTVRTDAASAKVRVAVRSGAVLLDARDRDEGEGIVLHQGDVGIVQTDGRTVARRGASTDDDVAWTRGRIAFHEAPLDEVRTELRRWYGIELRVADDAIANRHLTTSFGGEPPDRVLQVIALALGGHIERHGDTAVVRAGPAR